MKSKILISFEGMDGIGKTTIIEEIESVLKWSKIRYPILSIKEPNLNTLSGRNAIEFTKKQLPSDAKKRDQFINDKISAFVMARAETINNTIWPFINAMNDRLLVVLADRFDLSTMAYCEHMSLDKSIEIAKKYEKEYHCDIYPNYTVLLIGSCDLIHRNLKLKNEEYDYDENRIQAIQLRYQELCKGRVGKNVICKYITTETKVNELVAEILMDLGRLLSSQRGFRCLSKSIRQQACNLME